VLPGMGEEDEAAEHNNQKGSLKAIEKALG